MERSIWVAIALLVVGGPAAVGESSDPPADPRRTGYLAIDLQPPLQLAWVYADRHRPRPAWREPVWEPQRIDFDYAYPVAAAGDLVYFASSADHAVHALELATGESRWKFFTEGPVRLAPAVHNGRVYFGSDDGFVYCVDGLSGELVWRFRPPIPDERLLGNEQMISRWPARSGVLIDQGRAYTTFGMLAPEGVCICCLDPQTGELIWMNDTSGMHYMARPHVPGMGGVSPQGALAVAGDVLVVPCGRATPALFDKRTGQLIYHEAEGDFAGGAWTMTWQELVFTPCESLAKEYGSQLKRDFDGQEAEPFATASLVALHARTGREAFTLQGGRRGVLSGDGFLTLIGRGELVHVKLQDALDAVGKETTIRHTTGHFVPAAEHALWRTETGVVYTLYQAGNTLIAGGRGDLACFDAETGRRTWHATVEGQVRNLCVTADRLLASTTEGKIYCFSSLAEQPPRAPRVVPMRPVAAAANELARLEAADILDAAEVRAGYGLVLGEVESAVLAELARQSQLTLVVPAGERAAALRADLDAAGLYGTRVAVHDVCEQPLPYADYFADLVVLHAVSDSCLDEFSAAEIHRVLRPCGGVALILCPESLRAGVEQWLEAAAIPSTEQRRIEKGIVLRRGPLPGAGQWTHQYADPGKSCASDDQLVRLPLKALWFGGLGPDKIVSRHFRTPAPLVIDGRCFVPGTDHLIAMDIYNGRILWERELPELAHWPAAYRGPSLAVDRQAVYALQGTRCLRLDPATGQTLGSYEAPLGSAGSDATAEESIWEFLAVTDRLIVGTIGQPNLKREWWSKAYPANQVLFALDKATGELAWRYRAEEAIDSNAIAIDEQRVFLIDGRPRYAHLRRGADRSGTLPPRSLKALDLVSGDLRWQSQEISPTQNSLWVRDGFLVATINPYSRSMEDPIVAGSGEGVAVYDATDGRALWKLDDLTTCSPVLVGGTLYLPAAYDLRSGERVVAADPLSGREEHFVPSFPRTCSMLSGSPALLMARSGSLGFYDLQQRSGYYHYPILRASCWINMIPAGGLVVVPEGSSSCVCGYNYKTSMALMPDRRAHHYGISRPRAGGRVQSLRINFGAPGDRPDEAGNVWFAWPRPVAVGRPLAKAAYGPKVGGGELPVRELADERRFAVYSRNPDWMPVAGTPMPWLYACGIEGAVQLKIGLGPQGEPPGTYRVTLHFAELDPQAALRVFQVRLQGETVLQEFDLRRAAAAARTAVTREFTVSAADALVLELLPQDPRDPPPILSGLSIDRAD